ncbi:MAG: hypothetical protein LBV41_02475 [Cytophagaceae bacterium]|nr:hypothetical protein [Cytophagaceae bacterium]
MAFYKIVTIFGVQFKNSVTKIPQAVKYVFTAGLPLLFASCVSMSTLLLDTVPKYLLMGKSVSLGELGTLRITFSSAGVATAEEFVAGKIKGVRVLFTPSPVLRKAITDIKFEKEA